MSSERMDSFLSRLPTVLIPYIANIPDFRRHMLLYEFDNTRNGWFTRGSGFMLCNGWSTYPIPLELLLIKEELYFVFSTNNKDIPLMYMNIDYNFPYIYFTSYEQLKKSFPKIAAELKSKL